MCHGQRQPRAAADTRGGATPGLGLVWVAVKELKLSYHNGYTASMLGILCTFWGMGFLIFMKKGSFFLLRVMRAKYIGIMEKKMETTIMGLYRVQGLGFKLP